MSKYVEMEGKTVDEAIESALSALGVSKDDVEIEVLEEGKKGMLGFGSKSARVRVTVVDNIEEKIFDFLQPIFDKLQIEAEVQIELDEDNLSIKMNGEDVGILIGKRGETLDSIQYLLSLVINKNRDNYIKVNMDICDYRKKREETLIGLANRLADRVKKFKKSVTLEPMNPYERRIIHSTLQNDNSVQTYSVGDEPNRRVVVKLK